MLIVYKFNFKLPTIGAFLIFRRGEKLHDVILGEQGTSLDSHDLHDGTSKLEVVLNDSNETVCDDGDMNLKEITGTRNHGDRFLISPAIDYD